MSSDCFLFSRERGFIPIIREAPSTKTETQSAGERNISAMEWQILFIKMQFYNYIVYNACLSLL